MSEAEVQPALSIRGAIDVADTDGLLQGWCWSPDEPDVHRTITLLQDGEPFATILCNHPRPGLLRVGIGDGRNAFDLVIPPDEALLREGSIVTAMDTATGVLFSEAVVTQPAIPAAHAAPPSPAAVAGHLDEIGADGTVNGWCWFPATPDRHAEVVVVLDSEPIGTVLADLYRPDLHDAGVGRGDHGLSFVLSPESLHKAIGSVSLYEASSWTMIGDPVALHPGHPAVLHLAHPAVPDLAHSAVPDVAHPGVRAAPDPEPLAAEALPQPLAIEGSLDGVTAEGVVAGWCWYPAAPDRHVEVRIMVDDDPVATLTAGSYRLDLQEAGIGRGDHGVVAVLPWECIADKRLARITFHDAATDALIGKPFLLRRRGMALLDQRVRELEQQVRLLRSRLEETMQMRSVGYDQATRELFQTVGSFFTRLADGGSPDSAVGLGALLDEVTARHRPLHLATPADPAITLCIDAAAPLESLHACIAALQAARIDRQAAIVVIDDGTHEAAALLPTLVRNLDYVHLGPGGHLLAGRNEVAMSARTPLVAFLSPEVRVIDPWLPALQECLELDPHAAMVSASVVREDGAQHHAGLLVDAAGRLHPPRPASPAVTHAVDVIGDFAFVVRQADFVQVGGFDLTFDSLAAATFDLCLRLRASGHTVLQQPAAAVCLSARGSLDATRTLADLDGPDEDIRRLRQRWLRPGLAAPALPPSAQPVGRALVIDSVVPRPDEDAGSIATAEQMMLLRRLGYSVSFAPAAETDTQDRHGVRLQRQGIERVGPPRFESVTDYLDQHGASLDLVMVYRHGNMHALLARLPRMAPRARLVFVPCDLHFLREERALRLAGTPNEALVSALRGEELACVRASHATLLASDYEIEVLRPDVPPGRLRLLRWITATHPPRQCFEARSGLCFVAGFAHKPNEDAVIWFVREVMPLILAQAPQIQLHVVGSHMPPAVRALASPAVIVHGWMANLAPLFESVRMAVAPLRFGAGFKGKVATALAHGIPVVGTRIALEGTGLGPEDGVLFADAAADFAQAVLRLHADAELWSRLSERALERCDTLYSAAAALEVFRALLRDLGLPQLAPPAAG